MKAVTPVVPCLIVPSVEELRPVLQGRGTDFWVGSLADVSTADLPPRFATMRIEESLASEAFDCVFACASNDIKSDANSLIDEFGLGLRKTRSRSKEVPGCVFVLVSQDGPSALRKKYDGLQSTDKRLSTEERVRRTRLAFDIVPQSRLNAEAGHGKPFWLTAYTDLDAEACKKKVVSLSIEGFSAEDRFRRALIAEVKDCAVATDYITDRYGLSERAQRVRSKAMAGCIVLLMDPISVAEALSKEAVSGGGTGLILPTTSEHPSPPSLRKRNATAVSDVSPEGRAKHQRMTTAPSAATGCAASPTANGGGDTATARSTSQMNPEDLHCAQVCVIEKRLAILLPKLAREQLSTPYVQAKLEEFMKKPAGRLDKLRMDIARIWRSYAENASRVVHTTAAGA